VVSGAIELRPTSQERAEEHWRATSIWCAPVLREIYVARGFRAPAKVRRQRALASRLGIPCGTGGGRPADASNCFSCRAPRDATGSCPRTPERGRVELP
jgi:hypothetical protein